MCLSNNEFTTISLNEKNQVVSLNERNQVVCLNNNHQVRMLCAFTVKNLLQLVLNEQWKINNYTGFT